MSLRKFMNALLQPTKYRLCTRGELKTISAANRTPFEVIAHREPAARIQTIFDVGANIGQSTRQLRQLFPEAQIHAFEPTPESRKQYQCEHGNDPRAHLWPFALSHAPGHAVFHINKRSMTNSLLKTAQSSAQYVGQENVDNVTQLEVEISTITNFCAQNKISKIDILKLDIQGSELDALRGSTSLLEKKAIRYICLEAPFVLLYEQQAFFHEIVQFLDPYGYKVYGLFKLARHESDRLLFADALFFLEG